MLTFIVFLNIEFQFGAIIKYSINITYQSLAGYRPWGHKGVRCELATQYKQHSFRSKDGSSKSVVISETHFKIHKR